VVFAERLELKQLVVDQDVVEEVVVRNKTEVVVVYTLAQVLLSFLDEDAVQEAASDCNRLQSVLETFHLAFDTEESRNNHTVQDTLKEERDDWTEASTSEEVEV
jgi:glycyl-tRNA synthetase beta subunit